MNDRTKTFLISFGLLAVAGYVGSLVRPLFPNTTTGNVVFALLSGLVIGGVAYALFRRPHS